MAKTKADYVALGAADAAAGKSLPNSTASSWQEKAYVEGYVGMVRTMPANSANPQRPTELVKVWTMSRAQRDAQRCYDATIKRFARRTHLRSFDMRPARPSHRDTARSIRHSLGLGD